MTLTGTTHRVHRFTLRMLCLVAGILLSSCGGTTTEQPPKELLDAAWSNFILGEYKQATREFESVIAAEPEGSELHLNALYGLATAWNTRLPLPSQDKDLATELYNRLLVQAPEHPLAAWCLLGLARMKHLVPTGVEPDYEEVRAGYQRVIDEYPQHPAAEESLIFQQATLLATLEKPDATIARDALLRFIEEHPESGFVSPAYSLLSIAYTTLDHPEKRLWSEIQSFKRVEVDPENPDQDHSWRYWNIATIAEFECGDFTTARDYYGRLISSFPTDARMYAAEQALERMDRIEAEFRQQLAAERPPAGEVVP